MKKMTKIMLIRMIMLNKQNLMKSNKCTNNKNNIQIKK